MSTTTTTKTPQFNSDRERKSYAVGMAIVKKKLAGHHIETAEERRVRVLAEGRAIIRKMFKVPTKTTASPATRAASPGATIKALSSENGTGPRKLHRYCNRNWLPAAL